jgi:hypothetical protein
MDGPEIAFNVPDLGDSATPVVYYAEHTAGQFTGPLSPEFSWDLDGSYSSTLTGGVVRLPINPRVDSDGPRRVAELASMIPGDSIVFVQDGYLVTTLSIGNLSVGDTFDDTAEFYVDTPPEVQQTAIPPQVGWLVGGVLIGLGVKMTRRKA